MARLSPRGGEEGRDPCFTQVLGQEKKKLNPGVPNKKKNSSPNRRRLRLLLLQPRPHGPPRRPLRRLVRLQHLVQHLQQAGPQGLPLPALVHDAPVCRRQRARGADVALQAAPGAQGRQGADQGRAAAGRRAHAGQPADQRVAGRGRRVVYAHHQGDGALFLRAAVGAVPRRGALARGRRVSDPHRRRRRAGVGQRGHLQLGRVPGGDGVQRDLPVEERLF